MKVKATKRGYDNVAVREEGDVFDMPEGSEGSWFEPVETGKSPADDGGKKGKAKEKDLA